MWRVTVFETNRNRFGTFASCVYIYIPTCVNKYAENQRSDLCSLGLFYVRALLWLKVNLSLCDYVKGRRSAFLVWICFFFFFSILIFVNLLRFYGVRASRARVNICFRQLKFNWSKICWSEDNIYDVKVSKLFVFF